MALFGARMRGLVLFACILSSSAAQAKSIQDFWRSRPADAPRYQSSKSLLALEMCLGMEMSEKMGLPVVLHGEGETVITAVTGGLAQVPIGGVRIIDRGTGREVLVGATQAGGWTNKIGAMIQLCI